MFAPALLGKFSAAVCLSVAAVGGAVLLQAVWFFRDEVAQHSASCPVVAHGLSLGNRDRALLVVFTVHPPSSKDAPRRCAGVYDLSTTPPRLRELLPVDSPWWVASSATSRYGFVSAKEGKLYWLNLAAVSRQLHFLGRDEEGPAHVMECTDDGSILVVGNSAATTAWHRETARMLWRRSDIKIRSGCFLSQSRRLFCGLATGEVLELDSQTGATLRKIVKHDSEIMGLTISPDGKHMAAIDPSGNGILLDLETGRLRWSYRCYNPVTPRFSADGRELLVPNLKRHEAIAILSPASGQVVAELSVAKRLINGLTVTRDGTVYAWDTGGTITAWNLASRSMVYQIVPAVGAVGSSRNSRRSSAP